MRSPSNDPGWIENSHITCPDRLNKNCKFWRFPLLAKEIQLAIWEHAANKQSSHCRCLIILPKSSSDSDSDSDDDERLRAEYKIPELLHTCSDARKVALTRYRLAFRGQLIHPAYFNFNRDHLYFLHIEDVWMFYVDSRRGYRDLKRVKYILFTADTMDDHCVLSICERFPALKFLGFIERTPPAGSPPARPSRLFLPSEAEARFRTMVPHIIQGIHKREPNFGTWHAPTIFWGTFGQMAITIQNMQEEIENRMDWESTETVYL